MLPTGLLTTEDLDEIGCTFSAQPLEVAAELVDAVDRGLVANQADTGYALLLAAELTEREGDLEAAQTLAERAAEAYRAHGDSDYGYARSFRAGLLLQLGREDEAMTEWATLRPKLAENADIVSYLSETMDDGGLVEIAEQWLTAALPVALQRRQELESQRGEPAYEQAEEVVSTLVQYRHRLRRKLGLPHDEHDHLAERLLAAVREELGLDE